MRKLAIVIFKLVLAVLLISWTFICGAIGIFAYFIRLFDVKLANTVGTFVSHTVWGIFHMYYLLSVNMEIPEIPKGDYFVVSNHVNSADFLLINAINKYKFAHAKYAFKKTLRFIPIFYQGFISLNFLPLNRKLDKDKSVILKYANTLKKYMLPVWFIFFCEGTRFTQSKKEASDKFCKTISIEPYKNVLCPRVKGFSILHEQFKHSYIKKVLDLTFFSEDGEDFNLFNVLFTARTYRIKCDYRIVDINTIDDPEQFVYDSFRRKDRLIEEWKKNI